MNPAKTTYVTWNSYAQKIQEAVASDDVTDDDVADKEAGYLHLAHLWAFNAPFSKDEIDRLALQERTSPLTVTQKNSYIRTCMIQSNSLLNKILKFTRQPHCSLYLVEPTFPDVLLKYYSPITLDDFCQELSQTKLPDKAQTDTKHKGNMQSIR